MFYRSTVGTDFATAPLTSTTSTRILVDQQFLLIAPVVSDDIGAYFCTASNSAGASTSTFNLIAFGQAMVVMVEVVEFSSPSMDGTCHHGNQDDFEVGGGKKVSGIGTCSLESVLLYSETCINTGGHKSMLHCTTKHKGRLNLLTMLSVSFSFSIYSCRLSWPTSQVLVSV